MERAMELGLYNPVVFLMPSTRAEIRGEARAVKEKVAPQMDDKIIDEEIDGVSSGLQFDKPEFRHESESEVLLTRAERNQLKREVAPFKAFRQAVKSTPLLLMG